VEYVNKLMFIKYDIKNKNAKSVFC
jgi:hypothetical protein